MYVFVRKDLTPEQQAVQSCHSCIEATKAFDLGSLPDHPSVILLGIKNEQKLHEVRKYLVDSVLRHVYFTEADLNDELTTVAVEPIEEDSPLRSYFSKFQLLRQKGASNSNALHFFRYAWQFTNGWFYRWGGDCARDDYANLEDAYMWNSPQEAGDKGDGKVVRVRVTYDVLGEAHK